MRSLSWLLFTIFSLLSSCLLLVRTSETDGVETQDSASIPGHLEQLGSRNTKHSLEVIQNYPDPKTFFETYVVPSKPVLIQNAAKLSTAFYKWSDEYFLSRPEASKEKIQVEKRKKEERTAPYEEIPFSEFVEGYKEKDIYMVSSVPEFMKSDVLLPSPLLCRDVTETSDMLTDAVMWFSSGGTKSVLHFDDGLENINCLFAGTKELLFIDYHKYKHVVPIDFPEGRYSGVDVDRVDFVKYPGLIDVEYYNVTLKAGDCLYIPHRWFHQVRSYDRNIAVNLWWQHKANFVPKDCEGMEQNQTLEKFTFTTLEKLLEQPEETLMNHLKRFLGKNDHISFKTFVKKLRKDPYFGNNNILTWTEDMKSTTKKLFKLMDTDEDKSFSSADLEELVKADDETIRALTNEYFRLGDLMEHAQEKLQENNELYEEDYEDGTGDGDYDIQPVKRSGKQKSKEEL